LSIGSLSWLHKNSVAAIKTATLKKSNFLGSPQKSNDWEAVFIGIFYMNLVNLNQDYQWLRKVSFLFKN
jgi:hypothetical protein